MNKRIQKKRAKQVEEQAAEALEAAKGAAENSLAGTLERVRHAAADVQKALLQGDPKKAVQIVRERAGEAIGQVTQQVQEAIADKQQELKERLVETEEQAEELLKKVPGVGKVAAKKLHEVTHR